MKNRWLKSRGSQRSLIYLYHQMMIFKFPKLQNYVYEQHFCINIRCVTKSLNLATKGVMVRWRH